MSTTGLGGVDGQTADRWGYQRALRLVEPVVEEILATYATSFCLRPVRRSDWEHDGCFGVRWSIDGELMVELRYDGRVPVDLVVHDVTLMRPLRKRLRSRRIRVAHIGATPRG